MGDVLRIGPLHGGGLVLGYRCPSRCRHCLYGAGPRRRDGAPPDEGALEALLDELARRGPHARYHIGGGEPFLDKTLLRRAIDGLRRRGLVLEYVETNASWVTSARQAEEILDELAEVGLDCVLVSLSPFHAEFVPPRRTMTLIEAAQRVLRGGAFVWIADFLPDIAGVEGSDRLDLEALLESRGDSYARALASRYGLVPGGRTGRYLHHHGLRRPWQELVDEAPCRRRLADTSHFHVDGEGKYVPGLCAGIVLPLDAIPGEVDLSTRPILAALVREGVGGLVELAGQRGFSPSETYSSACDLCNHVRAFLFQAGYDHSEDELGPVGYYERFAFEAYLR